MKSQIRLRVELSYEALSAIPALPSKGGEAKYYFWNNGKSVKEVKL